MNVRYSKIDRSLFIDNRKRLAARLPKNAVAIVHSADEFPKNGDGNHTFYQSSDLFWLSGIDQEKSIVVIAPDATREAHREILFVRETNEEIAIWEGHKYTKDEARAASGIETVYWTHEFERVMHELILRSEHICLSLNENIRADVETEYRDLRELRKLQLRYPLHNYHRLGPIFDDLRSVKHSVEIELMQQACNITDAAFRRVLKFVKPGVWEHEIEAEIIHEFIRSRSAGHAYNPIIASGANSCVLHYNANNQQCKDGDIILFDFGAEYAHYVSDMSRCVPVNGKFTPRQRAVYDAVLDVMKFAQSMLKPGTVYAEYEKEIGRYMQGKLVDLNLLTQHDIDKQDPKWPAYKRYFMHGTSHFLGLDVHDVGNRDNAMQAGQVFSCEPGIYIREENLGIRLENDILLTRNGNIDLMEHIPLEAEEIETIMNS